MAKRSGGVAIITKSERAIIKMNGPLKKVYNQCAALLNSTSQGVLQGFRELGELVAGVREDPDTYKGGTVELLAEASNMSTTNLYKSQAFFESYTAAEFRELCQVRGPNGMRLNWAHVIHLLSVSDKNARLKYQQQAIEQAWSSDQLHQAIMEKYGNQRPGSGRKFVKPKTVTEGIKNYCAFTGELIKRTEQVWSITIDELAEIPIDEHTDESRAKLRELITLQGQAIDGMEQQRTKCLKVLGKVDKAADKKLTAK